MDQETRSNFRAADDFTILLVREYLLALRMSPMSFFVPMWGALSRRLPSARPGRWPTFPVDKKLLIWPSCRAILCQRADGSYRRACGEFRDRAIFDDPGRVRAA